MSKLQYEEFQNLYSSPNIIRVIKIKQDEIRRTCKLKRWFGRPMHI